MMAIKPVLLWTDTLLFVLVGMAIVTALYTRQREHLRAPWRYVRRQRMGMAALVILCA